MSKKTFKIKVRYTFEGVFEVLTTNRADAEKQAIDHCGLVIGGNIHTSSSDVIDWNFPVHPDKKLIK